jgi:hypothetical protein
VPEDIKRERVKKLINLAEQVRKQFISESK